MPYDPSNWYWIVAADEARLWSSARAQWVPAADAVYLAWVAAGGVATRVDSEQFLAGGLLLQYPAGWPSLVPSSVTPLQARRALRATGHLAAVNAAVAAADDDTKDAWEYATEVRRDNALIIGLGAAMGMSSTDIDNLFKLAATL